MLYKQYKDRVYGLDLLKVYATISVLFLHINSYVMDLFGKDTYPITTLSLYYLIEALSYPAIHLFVLIGSWFMIEKINPVKQISKVWSQTWIVTTLGLIVYFVAFRSLSNIWEGVSCIFPFLGRAYWFVTEYIILVMLAPFINKGLSMFSPKEMFCVTAIFGCIVCVFPTVFPVFPWYQDESEMANFILLYLIAGCIKKSKEGILSDAVDKNHENRLGNKMKEGWVKRRAIWVVIWLISAIVLFMSAMILHQISPNYEMYFYKYNSIFVVMEAVSIFMVFSCIETQNSRKKDLIVWFSGSSLVVYLVHMHPLFKNQYTEWELLKYVNINSPILYLFQICVTVLIVFVILALMGKAVNQIARLVSNRLIMFINRICIERGKVR